MIGTIRTTKNKPKYLFISLACLLISVLSGCASNVVFYDAIAKNYTSGDSHDGSIEVYVDAFGNIYPEDFGLNVFKADMVDSGSIYD